MNKCLAACLLVVCSSGMVRGQQINDPNFKFANPKPAFEAGQGPAVCLDEAHNNYHTAEGRYKGFADVVRGDGFAFRSNTEKFTAESLAKCSVMVIANPAGNDNASGQTWAYPHPPAFTREETDAIFQWIRGGGNLLLIADHSPYAGSVSGLATMLGAIYADGYAAIPRTGSAPSDGPRPDIFSVANGLLKPHTILQGRGADETVDTVGTFTGSAFQVSGEYTPILVLPPGTNIVVRWVMNFEENAPPNREWPRIPVGGWLQGAARTLGKGRVVLLGEAGMCSAQLAGPNNPFMGMNHPQAPKNAQFCLNTVRWLARVLEPTQ